MFKQMSTHITVLATIPTFNLIFYASVEIPTRQGTISTLLFVIQIADMLSTIQFKTKEKQTTFFRPFWSFILAFTLVQWKTYLYSKKL